jgi:hypothetical protein
MKQKNKSVQQKPKNGSKKPCFNARFSVQNQFCTVNKSSNDEVVVFILIERCGGAQYTVQWVELRWLWVG